MLPLAVLQQHCSAGCKAITTQGPWGWTLSCYTDKLLSTLISCSKGARTWFMCGQVLKQTWESIFKQSAKANIWQLGQNQYLSHVCSPLSICRASCGARAGFNWCVPSRVAVLVCLGVSAALPSVFLLIAEVLKNHNLLSVIFFPPPF